MNVRGYKPSQTAYRLRKWERHKKLAETNRKRQSTPCICGHFLDMHYNQVEWGYETRRHWEDRWTGGHWEYTSTRVARNRLGCNVGNCACKKYQMRATLDNFQSEE